MKEELAKVVKAHSDSVADKSSRETKLAQFKSSMEIAERQVLRVRVRASANSKRTHYLSSVHGKSTLKPKPINV